jgi:hypothetical protein
MKKVILLFLIAATIVSCKKSETTQPAEDQYAEVSFNVTTLVPDAGRDWVYDYDVPECVPDAIPGWALMKITDAAGNELEGDGVEGPNGSNYFKVLVFYTNGELYTQSVKLPVTMCDDGPCCDTYYVTEFFVYDETGVPYKAAPSPDSEFFQFVTQTLPVTLEICAFDKKEFKIDVLCFTPDYYELFGFFWFEITEITVREVCFFGDVCIDWWMEPSQWHQYGVPLSVWYDETEEDGNLYQGQLNGIQMDMPAIFALVLFKWDAEAQTWVSINSWSNEDWYGEGEPLCFRYADYDAIDGEQFAIAMYILGPWNYAPDVREATFGFTIGETREDLPTNAQHLWYFTDNALEDLDLNGDGVIEFAWGDCVEDPEYHLPETAGK